METAVCTFVNVLVTNLFVIPPRAVSAKTDIQVGIFFMYQ